MKNQGKVEATEFEYKLYSSLLRYQSSGVDEEFKMPDGKMVPISVVSEVFGEVSFGISNADLFGEAK